MQPAGSGPYISVVVACDGAPASASTHAKRFVESWSRQARRYGLESELIVVASAPSGTLSEQFDSRAPDEVCEARLIEVQPECLIRRHGDPPRRNLRRILENIGIRSARGDFILATNIDVLLSHELVQFLAGRRLDRGRMYRADTYEVTERPAPDMDLDDQLAFCRRHAVRLFALEGTFELTSEALRQNFPTDIAAIGSGLTFGRGWFPPGPHPATGETIRWMRDNAEFLARVPDGGGILTIEIEPGPGIETLPQTIEVVDETGSQVARWSVDRRITMSLLVPARESGKLKRFRLRLSDGGAPLLDDPRILDVAAFRCDWVDRTVPPSPPPSLLSSYRQNSGALKRLLANFRNQHGLAGLLFRAPAAATRASRLLARRGSDIFESGMDFQLGPGWYYREEAGPERFRWVSKDAQLLLRMPPRPSRLAMLVEPGPAHHSFVLVVRSRDESGDLLAKIPICGLTYFEFPAPAAPGTIAPLYLTADPPAPRGNGDPRVLSFRVFAFGAGANVAHPDSKYCDWLTLSIDSRPAGKDWIAALQPLRREIAQLGKPEYLHTNRCGDFILMSRARWLDLRGFAAADLPSDHLDALLCYAAHHAGAREELLQDPLRVYRLHDDSASEPRPGDDWQAALHDDRIWLIRQMRALHTPVIFNSERWGETFEPPPSSG